MGKKEALKWRWEVKGIGEEEKEEKGKVLIVKNGICGRKCGRCFSFWWWAVGTLEFSMCVKNKRLKKKKETVLLVEGEEEWW